MSQSIQHELEQLRLENQQLKAQLRLSTQNSNEQTPIIDNKVPAPNWDYLSHGLSKDQIARYSRQIVLPSFGVEAQSRLCKGSVLIVGAGGLGSPAAIYLAAVGIGCLGIVDHDTVDLSNIHRQIIHTESTVGTHKVDSAIAAIHAINSSTVVKPFKSGLTTDNAVQIIKQFDVIIDATDNAPTRYLLSDACVVAKRPLVSGAAIGTDGQLTVYCHGDDGPCYRCLYPEAPPPQNCQRCVDAGVLGIVPGIIGTMQALEAVKILSKKGTPMSRRMLVMDAMDSRFHVVKLRGKSAACIACGTHPKITEETLCSYDYMDFTGQVPTDKPSGPLQLIPREERITVQQLSDIFVSSPDGCFVLVDVRPKEQFNICQIPGSINFPWTTFDKHIETIALVATQRGVTQAYPMWNKFTGRATCPVYVVCRRGNDSQRAVVKLRKVGMDAVDVVGGVEQWARDIDQSFPVY